MVAPLSSTPNPFLLLLGQLKPLLDAQLDATLAEECATQGAFGPEVAAMLSAAQGLSRGGKRLRAGLLAAGYLGYQTRTKTLPSASDLPLPVLEAGLALELLQSYFLIHDDWMDQDATRRGCPTVHTTLSQQFASNHLGACGAVLAGDYVVTLAHRVFHPVALGASNTKALLEEFTAMQLAAIVGQQLDVVALTKEPLRVYELKTGSYTVNGPLSVGALLGGADKSVLTDVAAFAKPTGIAFQLRDDLLNLFADPALTGKPLAGDITAGKWTWTATWLLNNANADERSRFEAAFGRPDAPQDTLHAAIAAVERSGARAATETHIQQLYTAASEQLDRLALSAAGHALWAGALDALVNRAF
jgi:geranylgeranyl diphosphate synthase, type I